MMIRTETSNHGVAGKCIAIRQFDGATELLKVDLSTGGYGIVSAQEIGKEKIAFGLFEREDGSRSPVFLALVATPDGPLLISNGIRYQPLIGKTQAVIVDHDGGSQFRLLHEGSPVLEIAYQEKWGIGLHPYANNREDIDFYFWLAGQIDQPKLYQAYTRETTYLDA